MAEDFGSEYMPDLGKFAPLTDKVRMAWRLLQHPNEPSGLKHKFWIAAFFWALWFFFPEEGLAFFATQIPAIGVCLVPFCGAVLFVDDALLAWAILTTFINSSPDEVKEYIRQGIFHEVVEGEVEDDDSMVIETP